jgi:hypothetical protein
VIALELRQAGLQVPAFLTSAKQRRAEPAFVVTAAVKGSAALEFRLELLRRLARLAIQNA